MNHADIKARYEAEYPTNIKSVGISSNLWMDVDSNKEPREAAIKAATYERELHTLKFAEWLLKGYNPHGGFWYKNYNDESGGLTTDQLFQIFLNDNK